MKNEQAPPVQFQFIDSVKKLMLNWAQENDIKLHDIDYVVPFVQTDKSLAVWLFYDTDNTMNFFKNNGTTETVKLKYLQLLAELNYPADYLNEVSFFIDSNENIKTHFRGSNFYRLR
ncbi:hypothetical protein [Pedobacter xixiisoli]|uniref:Uncharacterized protein n=1 Tax=Pedobacter xixiisoli TaxID=1476464 RepID=A0A286ADH5_9SPHI|nr:hypothetical protein [Pedobacter xixiisoli]SOD19943.1 hypothetical protein SAMN06297358_3650 [Pedobacter xixiisoli]